MTTARLDNLELIYDRAYAFLQINDSTRVVVVKSVPQILIVYMDAHDGDAVKASSNPPSIEPPEEAGRQRNEVRYRHPTMINTSRNPCMFSLDILIEDYGSWFATGPEFYHIMQIKAVNISRPIFTVGLKNGVLTVHRVEGSNIETKYTIDRMVGKWFTVQVTLDPTASEIHWKVGKSESGTFPYVFPEDEYYLKSGIYRSFPNTACFSTIKYRNIYAHFSDVSA